jgi:hypothetical protein
VLCVIRLMGASGEMKIETGEGEKRQLPSFIAACSICNHLSMITRNVYRARRMPLASRREAAERSVAKRAASPSAVGSNAITENDMRVLYNTL